jgi:putative selenium metabolism hydrolase
VDDARRKAAQDLAVDLTARLIQAPSLSGEEGPAAEVLAQAMRKAGFDEVRTDRYGSVLGTIEGDRPGPTILLDGHLDTVPVPDASAWSRDPLGGEVADGKVYGRGASDMKGALAAMLAGADLFAASTSRSFAGRIVLAGVVQEELFEGIAARSISKEIAPDVVIIGEATELNLNIGQRGRAEIVVETMGVPAHSANPDKGVNAVLMMARLLTRIEETLPPSEHPVLGRGIAVCTDILSTPYPGASVVPSGCRATFDRRTLVGEDRDSVLAPFRAVIDELGGHIPDFKADVRYSAGDARCYTGEPIAAERFFPAWLFAEDEAFVQRALVGLRSMDIPSKIGHYSFCTNGSHYAGEKGLPTLGFGPSRENLAHTIDEYVEVDQLHAAAAGYAGILGGLLES